MYKKIIKDGYIVALVANSKDGNITEQEYNEIMAIIKTPREEAPKGYAWKLRNDTLEYELVYQPEEA